MTKTRVMPLALALGMGLSSVAGAQDDVVEEGIDYGDTGGADAGDSGPRGTPGLGGETAGPDQKNAGFYFSSKQPWLYPVSKSARPLTMQGRMIRASFRTNIAAGLPGVLFGFGGGGAVFDTAASLDFGGAFAVNDDLEIGINSYREGAGLTRFANGLITIVVAPDADFGDIPLYMRYRFLNKRKLEWAADLVLVMPSFGHKAFALVFGAPLRFNPIEDVAIDSGVEFAIVTNDAGIDIELPFKVTYNLNPEIFVWLETGFVFGNLGRASGYNQNNLLLGGENDFSLPLMFGGGYALLIKEKVIADIYASFGFREFANFTTDGDGFDPGNSWVVAIGVNFNFEPVGKN